jgi:AcrR family transcriptional regulator
MARRTAPTQAINTRLQRGRKSTQRERLLNGMIVAANRGGYSQANVSVVIAEAGVSRPTFYDYFRDRDDCFVAAVVDVQEQLLADVGRRVREGAPERALRSTVEGLAGFASAEPARARFLMSESMAAGHRALTAREQGLLEIERIVEEAHRLLSPDMAAPDVPSGALCGGIYRLLAARLRRGEPGLSGLGEELDGWVTSYEQPAAEHRWRTLRPGPAPPVLPFVPRTSTRPPGALRPGRPSVSKQDVAENHRRRILYSVAQLIAQKGYNATTIADVVKDAELDTRAFYALFEDKQDAFMAVHERGVQKTMSITAEAFFSGASWPERIWLAGRALTQLLDSNPTLTRLGFVEAYAVGPAAVQRMEDSQVAFSVFFQEGYLHLSAAPPPRAAVEATIATIFETVHRQARANGEPALGELLAHLAFLSLAPFLGAAETNEFIKAQLEREAS